MRGKARKTGTGRGEKKIRKKSLEKVITGKSGRAGGGEKRERQKKRESSCSCSFEELPDFYSDSRLCHMI